jgi:hypothetical protein
MNFSGNVGKSTVTRHLFRPRLPSHTFIEVESINTSGNSGVVVRGEHAGQHLDNLLLEPETLFDVGGSNVEAFLEQIEKRFGAHEDIDLFVIPTIASAKQIQDTLNTALGLLRIGVPDDKIVILPNRIKRIDIDNISSDFGRLFNLQQDYPGIRLNASVYIPENELYPLTARMKNADGTPTTVSDLASDTTDYRTLIAQEPDKEIKTTHVRRYVTVRLAKAVNIELDRAFQAIMGV